MDTEGKIPILLVDGSKEKRQRIISALNNPNWEILEAETGEKALELIGSRDFAVVLLDVRLPGMNGFGIAERIRLGGKSESLPIIFLSAIPAPDGYVNMASALGAVDFLFSPLVPKVFQAKVAVFANLFLKTETLKYNADRLDEKARKRTDLREQVQTQLQSRTERKEAEVRLRRSEERYRRLFESARDGILILDAEGGHIADVNPFLSDFLGYTREELLGKQLWEIGLFKDIEANQEAFRILQEKGFIRYEDLPLKTKQGLSRDVEFVSNSYPVGDDTVIQCNIRDITERNEAQKAFHISEESLRQSKKMEGMGKLSGGIAHDFNNILTAVNGYAEMALSMAEPGGNQYGYLAEILKAGERATALTKQLLAFSRQQVLVPKVLRLNAIVTEMHGMLASLIGETVHIRQNLDPGLGRVQADVVQIQQILMNLVINAGDSMPQGGGITISTSNAYLDGEYAAQHPDVATKDYVLLSVRDTGTGMDADVKGRIFDPFFTTKELGKGTGMGLATVHGIVEQSKGHITVESSPGNGSTFRVYLPRTDREEEIPVVVPGAEDAGDHGSGIVLLVEDDAVVRTLVRKVLETHGYTVLEAANGAVAMAISQTHEDPISLLLTDLMIPGMNGRELARRFMRMRPEGQVLFMSGYTNDIAAQQDLVDEGGLFIQKPFSPGGLAEAVREVLKRRTPIAS